MTIRLFSVGAIVILGLCSGSGFRQVQLSNSNTSNPSFELNIDIELAQFEGRSHRPFVAIWLEDKDKEVIRDLSLLYNKPRWLNELKQWFNKHSGTTLIDGVTGATRSPGKYSIRWDINDNKGEAVKAGKYMVYIEAAREHGTYQIIKQEITLNGKPQHIELKGGTEISAASLDYHAVAQK